MDKSIYIKVKRQEELRKLKALENNDYALRFCNLSKHDWYELGGEKEPQIRPCERCVNNVALFEHNKKSYAK